MSARQKEFLETGAQIAAKVGIVNVTRRAIAEHHQVTDPLVGKHVGGKAELQDGIKRTMKRLKLKEPPKDVIEEQGRALRARKEPVVGTKKPLIKDRAPKKVAGKVVTKKVAASKKRPEASEAQRGKTTKKAAPAKKSVVASGKSPKPVAKPRAAAASKSPTAEPKRFKPKAPPLPALPEL